MYRIVVVPPSAAVRLKERSGRYQHANFDRTIYLLDEINWEEVLQGDVDQMWTAWEEKFVTVMHHCKTINEV